MHATSFIHRRPARSLHEPLCAPVPPRAHAHVGGGLARAGARPGARVGIIGGTAGTAFVVVAGAVAGGAIPLFFFLSPVGGLIGAGLGGVFGYYLAADL